MHYSCSRLVVCRFILCIIAAFMALLILLLLPSIVHSRAPEQAPDQERTDVGLAAKSTSEPVSQAAAPAATNRDEPYGSSLLVHGPAGEPDHLQPSVAYNPDREEYLVVWYNDRPVNPDIQAQRVSWDGSALVGSSFYISGGDGASRTNPDVVYNTVQKEYLIVWEHQVNQPSVGRPDIHARRLSGKGDLLGSEFTVGTGSALRSRVKPAVAYATTANKYMVVWESRVQGSLSSDIEAQVVAPSGALENTNFIVYQGNLTNSHHAPDIAYNRSRNEYLVVWTWNEKNAPNYDIRGSILSRDGILLKPNLIVGYYSLYEYDASVAGLPTAPNAGEYMVAWRADYGSDLDIYGRRVLGDGTLESYIGVSETTQNERRPAVAADESSGSYLVAYTYTSPPSPAQEAIVGKKVDTSNNVGNQYPMFESDTIADDVAVASGHSGNFLIVFSATDGGSDRNIYARLWALQSAITVSSISTGGSVSSNPSGIYCPTLCEAWYLQGSDVTLEQLTQVGYEFTGWGGDCSGTSSTCNLNLNTDKNVTASFAQRTFILSVSKNGEGTVTSVPAGVNCGSDCSETYTVGTSVTLTAKPATGWKFGNWGLACSGTTPDCQLAPNSDKSISATFVRSPIYIPSAAK